MRGPQNRDWRLAEMSLLNLVPAISDAVARSTAEIVYTASFCVGFANPALVGYPEATCQVQAARVFGN